MDAHGEEIRELQQRAGAAFESGRLREAAQLYARLVELRPEREVFHYRLGLAHKYLRDWPRSLRCNLDALALGKGHDEGASWNAGIAASALGDWAQARGQWFRCGIRVKPGNGPIEDDFGPIGLRLNPWSGGETVYAKRIDPARARISNVPLPSSGHRYRDLVLHDGVQVGERRYFEHKVPVFNELQRLEASAFRTFTVFVSSESDDEIEALQRAARPGVGLVEDWTPTLRQQCLRCSYDIAHKHHRHGAGGKEWNPDRSLGVAAQDEAAVERLLKAWVAGDRLKRRLDAIECREQAPPEPPADARAWWR